MNFTNYLKKQLSDFVESYKKYFWQTLGTVLAYTVMCFVVMVLLLRFSNFNFSDPKRQLSVLSYFFTRYSVHDTYCLVDLSKSVFLFFVSLFSIGLLRLKKNSADEKNEFSFNSFTKRLKGNDIISLIGILILCLVIDYCLYLLDIFTETNFQNHDFQLWIYSLVFLLRIYIPMILFSIMLFKLTSDSILKINFKNILFLFVSLWLFNEFAYEISIFVRLHIIDFILIPFTEENKYLYESFLGIPLIAFYFVGYHSAMTTSLRLLNKE